MKLKLLASAAVRVDLIIAIGGLTRPAGSDSVFFSVLFLIMQLGSVQEIRLVFQPWDSCIFALGLPFGRDNIATS